MIVASGTNLWPLAVYSLACVVLAGGMLLLSHVLGQRHSQKATGEPYESGMASSGTRDLRIGVRYYLVAMLFVIFDVQAVFIFLWALSARDLAAHGMGWTAYIEIALFIMVLLAGLAYVVRQGVLDWSRRGPRPSGPKD